MLCSYAVTVSIKVAFFIAILWTVVFYFYSCFVLTTCVYSLMYTKIFSKFASYVDRLLQLLYSACWWSRSMLSLPLSLEAVPGSTFWLPLTLQWYVSSFDFCAIRFFLLPSPGGFEKLYYLIVLGCIF